MPPTPKSSIWEGANQDTLALRKNPLKNYPLPRSKAVRFNGENAAASSSRSAPPPAGPPPIISSEAEFNQDRLANIRAAPAPGRRPEKLRFDLSLLLTDDNVEYCIQEARARSKGLLGKKWGPPPEVNEASGSNNRRGRAPAYAEPTVTLATKEALADVFGMYNSPERTMKYGAIAGSKHAPVKKVEPMTPLAPSRLPSINSESEGDRTVSKSLLCDNPCPLLTSV